MPTVGGHNDGGDHDVGGASVVDAGPHADDEDGDEKHDDEDDDDGGDDDDIGKYKWQWLRDVGVLVWSRMPTDAKLFLRATSFFPGYYLLASHLNYEIGPPILDRKRFATSPIILNHEPEPQMGVSVLLWSPIALVLSPPQRYS